MKSRIACVALICSIGCGSSAPGEPQPTRVGDALPLRRTHDRKFVVFSVPSLVVDRVGVEVPAPVTVGSSPSPATMSSDAPGVLDVTEAGGLIAHGEGRATIRATGSGSQLAVQVVLADDIRIDPPTLRLGAGEEARVRVLRGDGQEVPAAAVGWSMSAPGTARVDGGVVRAGQAGAAMIQARYGSATARARVDVAAAALPSLAITPARARLHAGELAVFQAMTPSGPIDATWATSSPTIVSQVDGNVFRAGARGEAWVCASAGSQRACTKVGVQP